MSSREEILKNIKLHVPSFSKDLPDTNIPHVSYENKNEQFSKSLKSVGGNAVWLKDESIEEFVNNHYKDLNVITYAKQVDPTCDVHTLENVDLAIIEGEFAIAENGAVWVKNPENCHRALYFLAQQLLIIVKKENIIDSMHEAYEKVNFDESGYGTFISGPSKTADIEQSLVIGAHGPTDACVLFV